MPHTQVGLDLLAHALQVRDTHADPDVQALTVKQVVDALERALSNGRRLI